MTKVKASHLVKEPLSKHTTFRIGGPAGIWVEPESVYELKEILNQKGLPYRIIGNGSNILIKDRGVPGVVIKMSNFKELSLDNDKVRAGSGVNLSELIRFSIDHSLSGIEFLAGIPGTVGGAVKTNAGAQGRQIADVLYQIEIMDRDGNIFRLSRDKIDFGYRHSNIGEGAIILGASFSLIPDNSKKISNRVREYLDKRDDIFPKRPNPGCIFKNPPGAGAGELIDRLGLKGTRRGKAMVSARHANIIVNLGGAKARDVLELIEYVKGKVYTETGINLELEIECW